MSVSNRLKSSVTVRSVDRESLTVDIIASTPALDSYNTRIDQSGWDLEAFKKNPVICYSHQTSDGGWSGSSQGAGLPVANAIPETVRVEDNKLMMKIRFTPEDVSEFGYKVFRMVEAGFIHGVSVGFSPTLWEDVTEKLSDGSENRVRIFRKQTLGEVSIVTIPANDEAMVVRSKEMNREGELEQFRTLATEIEKEAKEHDHVSALESFKIGETEVSVEVKSGDVVAFRKEFDIVVNYMERKKPANKASTHVLDRFFKKILKEDTPAEEVKAWERMGEAIESMSETDELKPEEKTENHLDTPAAAPQAEAAPPERSMPLSTLKALPKAFKDHVQTAVDKAMLEGIPTRKLRQVAEDAGKQFLQSISHP